ncbi:MAG: hypothetical protein JWN00_4896 [Actinomycetia bacterium]|nr:hypothetical protein [Actinomycetes bacterium]
MTPYGGTRTSRPGLRTGGVMTTAEDVAAVRSDDQYFRYGPGNQQDEL